MPCKTPCKPAVPSEGLLRFEPMFDTTKDPITHQVADAIDLAIDFATLGEYGLEPVQTAPRRPCEGRQRPLTSRSTGAWRSAIDHFAAH